MDQNGESEKRVAAPYISYQTIKTFIAPLKEHVIPNRIDKSLLRSFSGAVQAQLMTALKFLRLINEDGTPSESLKKLVSAYGTDNWEEELQGVLRDSYPELFDIPLAKVSPSEFSEAFKKSYPCEGETLRKGITFFLNAGRDAGVSFSPFLLKNAKPRSGPVAKRRGRIANKNGRKDEAEDNAGGAKSLIPPASSEDPWLAKYPAFDPNWGPEIQKGWFAGYSELMALRKKSE
jgi:hypothetical protein